MMKLSMRHTVVVSVIMLAQCISARNSFSTPATTLPVTASGKVWIVPLDTSPSAPHPGGRSGVDAIFPVPAATPDVIFSTNTIDFFSPGPFDPSYMVGNYLSGPAFNVTYSGLPNPNLPGSSAVGPSTELYSESNGSWGTYMEITGTISLVADTTIMVDHDDGVSLKLNGVNTGCFVTPGDDHYLAGTDVCLYSGPAGLVPFDLVYSEGFDVRALLDLTTTVPSQVPEPSTWLLVATSVVGLLGYRSKGSTRRCRRVGRS
jgi:hypothetical protein